MDSSPTQPLLTTTEHFNVKFFNFKIIENFGCKITGELGKISIIADCNFGIQSRPMHNRYRSMYIERDLLLDIEGLAGDRSNEVVHEIGQGKER